MNPPSGMARSPREAHEPPDDQAVPIMTPASEKVWFPIFTRGCLSSGLGIVRITRNNSSFFPSLTFRWLHDHYQVPYYKRSGFIKPFRFLTDHWQIFCQPPLPKKRPASDGLAPRIFPGLLGGSVHWDSRCTSLKIVISVA